MVAARLLEHVRNEFCGDGSPALVLFVLAGVGKEGEDGGNAFCTCDFARVDHDADLHEGRVDLPAAGVDNVHIVFAHGLGDADNALANAILRYFRSCEGYAEPEEGTCQGRRTYEWMY